MNLEGLLINVAAKSISSALIANLDCLRCTFRCLSDAKIRLESQTALQEYDIVSVLGLNEQGRGESIACTI